MDFEGYCVKCRTKRQIKGGKVERNGDSGIDSFDRTTIINSTATPKDTTKAAPPAQK